MKTKCFFVFILLSVSVVSGYLVYQSLFSYYVFKAKPLRKIEYNETDQIGKILIKLSDGQLIYRKQFSFVDEIAAKELDSNLVHALHILFSEKGYASIFDYYVINYFPSLKAKWENKYLNRAALDYLKNNYSKKELCLYYLNKINFGKNIRGVGGLSLYLFGQEFNHLKFKNKIYVMTFAVNSSEKGNKSFPSLFRQVDGVLWQMFTKGIIDYEFYRKASDTIIDFDVYDDFRKEQYLPLIRKVEAELKRKSVNYTNGIYEVQLALRPDLNMILADRLNKYLKAKPSELKAAYVLINYKEGYIESIYGTRSYNYNDVFSRVWKMKRQTGSVFKPFVYATAFEKGIKPYDYIVDKQRKYKIKSGYYSPDNYADYYMGKTYVRNGLVYSLNNATVKLASEVGLQNVADTAEKFGLSKVRPYLSMPLGSNPFNILDMAKSYTVFANKGVKKDISFIKSVIKNGKSISINEADKRVISGYSAEETLQCMKDVVRIGTARKSDLLRGTAGKTGTTNDYKDAWFVGIRDPYVLMVWVGSDDMRSMGEKGTGGEMAAPLVANLQKYLYSDKKYTMKNK